MLDLFFNRVDAEVRPGLGCGVSAGDCIHHCGAGFGDVPAPRVNPRLILSPGINLAVKWKAAFFSH